jgi:hypothetical protein
MFDWIGEVGRAIDALLYDDLQEKARNGVLRWLRSALAEHAVTTEAEHD